MSDEYGTDLALTLTGDLSVGSNGALGAIDGPANVAQALTNRMRTAPGDLPLHPEYGSNLVKQLVGSKADEPFAAARARVELRTLIEEDQRFLAARSITPVTADDTPNVLGIRTELELTGGELLTVSDVADPRMDEIDFSGGTTLADFSDDPTLDFDGESVADVQDDLPELDELLEGGPEEL